MKSLVYIALSQFCERDESPRHRLLESGCEVRQNNSGRRLKREEVAKAIGDADAVIAGLEPYDEVVLRALPRVRCISRCGVGTDAIDLEVAQRLGIAVLNTPDEVVEPVAQLTIGMILGLARNFPLYGSELRQGVWRRHEGFLLSEWTIGLVGFGRIGRAVERYLRPFGPRILVADPVVGPANVPSNVELRDLSSLLAEADLISLHASRRPDESPLLDAAAFKLIKRGSRLVNTARGQLVDEKALCAALESGDLAGAALDAYAEEPYTGPLVKFPQVLSTPHIGTLTNESRRAMEMRCVENVLRFLAGG